jgi:hypothetical protein
VTDNETDARIVEKESVALLERVEGSKWVAEDSIDLQKFAEERGQNSIWIYSVGVVEKGSFRRQISVGCWPRQVVGDEKIVFLCGGSSVYEVRLAIKWLLIGAGPKYEISKLYRIVS